MTAGFRLIVASHVGDRAGAAMELAADPVPEEAIRRLIEEAESKLW